MLFLVEIQKYAIEYKIDASWIQAIIAQESNWNPKAIRYESSYRWTFTPQTFSELLNISVATEMTTQKISWGLGQLMGAVAREQGHQGMMTDLLDPDLNIKHIAIRLSQLRKRSDTLQETFACYNGGFGALKKVSGKFKNQEYVDSVLRHLKKFKAT